MTSISRQKEGLAIPITPEGRAEKRARRAKSDRIKKTIEWLALGSVITAIVAEGISTLNKHNHREGVRTMAALKAELGHIPSTIRSIKPTEDSEVQVVDYVVGRSPEKQMVSAISDDLHPMAPNQTQPDENPMVATYIENPADRKAYTVRGGSEYHFLVNTKTGEILPKHRSAESNS